MEPSPEAREFARRAWGNPAFRRMMERMATEARGMAKTFNVGKFYAMLDQRRYAMGLDWKEVATLTGVSSSLFSRMSRGQKPDADNLVRLCVWAQLDLRDYA